MQDDDLMRSFLIATTIAAITVLFLVGTLNILGIGWG
jgi:hypothetical protein